MVCTTNGRKTRWSMCRFRDCCHFKLLLGAFWNSCWARLSSQIVQKASVDSFLSKCKGSVDRQALSSWHIGHFCLLGWMKLWKWIFVVLSRGEFWVRNSVRCPSYDDVYVTCPTSSTWVYCIEFIREPSHTYFRNRFRSVSLDFTTSQLCCTFLAFSHGPYPTRTKRSKTKVH